MPTSSSTVGIRFSRSTRHCSSSRAGKAYVEVETAPQTFERREIQTGLSDGITIEVLAGLAPTDRLKSKPAPVGVARS